MLPEGPLTHEPPRPALVDRLRLRMDEGAASWREALREAERDAVVWRWAHPHAMVEPLRVECLWGRSTRWHDRPPPASWDARHAGADASGRLVLVRDPSAVEGSRRPAGDLLTIIRHRERRIETWDVYPADGLQSASEWLLDDDGRIAEGAEAGPDRSWRAVRFGRDGGGVVRIDEVWWTEEERSQTYGGWSRSDVTYDGDGRLARIVHFRSVDRATLVPFSGKPLAGRALADELDRRLREALRAALSAIERPHEVGVIGLVYDTFGIAPPTLLVERSDRLHDAAALSLDDVMPLEWGAPEADVVDLARFGAWPVLHEDAGPRVLHRRIRALVRDTDRDELRTLLGTPRPPVLVAMDTEGEHRRVNVADAFGRSVARRVVPTG